MSKGAPIAPLPSREDILAYIRDAGGDVNKRDIARAFSVRGPDKVQLKKMLREMAEEGLIARDPARRLRAADRLPGVILADYDGLSDQGEVLLRPAGVGLPDQAEPAVIILEEKRRKGPAMGPGDRALVRLTFLQDAPPTYKASIIKRLQSAPESILGVFRGGDNGGRLEPIDKKAKREFRVHPEDVKGCQDGELVLATPLRAGKRNHGARYATISERLGDVSAPSAISLIAIHAHNIPTEFPADALKEASAAEPVGPEGRTDLRDTPLITIDPRDARDHDDAIFAEPDPDPKNRGGFHLVIAIADVAHYVQPGSALDREARKRGNSCYFPDRVVPMLPEALSTDLCSLKPGVDRAAMALHIWIDASGQKRRHRFERALIKSAGNLAYEEVQMALDGAPPTEAAEPLLTPVLKPLKAAFDALMAARDRRNPLALELPERRIELDAEGRVAAIVMRERYDAHRIVEEFMILANVCAAETLEEKRVTPIYRVHEEPPADKLEQLREFLQSLDLSLSKGTVMRPALFNGILSQVVGSPHEAMVNQVVLRSQTQAYYAPDNKGHFGLALPRYAHFTSPIRRYADLIVHRGLVRALVLGDGGVTDPELGELDEIGEHISNTERRAMAAERDSVDRYLAAYLSDKVGGEFSGRVTGVTRAGLFVALEPSGGDGLLPISSLGREYFRYEQAQHRLVGEMTGEAFKLGDTLKVKLIEASPVTGGLRLALAQGGAPSQSRRRFSAKKGGKGRASKGKRRQRG